MGRLLALGILGTLACASLASAQGSITGTVTTAVKGVPPVRVTIDQKVCGDELPDEAIIVDAPKKPEGDGHHDHHGDGGMGGMGGGMGGMGGMGMGGMGGMGF